MNRSRAIGGWFLALALWLSGAATVRSEPPASPLQRTIIIVTIDGMRPEFYLAGELATNCPTLVKLRDTGSYARAAIAGYPTVTYPGHASIATGVSPARHGITGNQAFAPPGTDLRGFWYASDLKVPALWDVAHAAKLTVGALSWPSTAKSAAIDWNLPEFWSTSFGKQEELIRRFATPGLVDAGRLGAALQEKGQGWDALVAECAVNILQNHRPNLLFVHFEETDQAQHRGGLSAADLPAVLRRVDAHLAAILDAAKAADASGHTTVIVLGDHGFANVAQSIAPNWLLAQRGFITLDNNRVSGWKAAVQPTSGSAGVYLKDPRDAETAREVHDLLAKNAVAADGARLYRLVEREELSRIGGPPGAAFYLEAEPGYMFSGSFTGKELVRGAALKGTHGYWPEKPAMRTGLVVAGFGIKPGVTLETVRLVDVAPTAARLLGLTLEHCDGRVLAEFLESDPGSTGSKRPRAAN